MAEEPLGRPVSRHGNGNTSRRPAVENLDDLALQVELVDSPTDHSAR